MAYQARISGGSVLPRNPQLPSAISGTRHWLREFGKPSVPTLATCLAYSTIHWTAQQSTGLAGHATVVANEIQKSPNSTYIRCSPVLNLLHACMHIVRKLALDIQQVIFQDFSRISWIHQPYFKISCTTGKYRWQICSLFPGNGLWFEFFFPSPTSRHSTSIHCMAACLIIFTKVLLEIKFRYGCEANEYIKSIFKQNFPSSSKQKSTR